MCAAEEQKEEEEEEEEELEEEHEEEQEQVQEQAQEEEDEEQEEQLRRQAVVTVLVWRCARVKPQWPASGAVSSKWRAGSTTTSVSATARFRWTKGL